MSYLTVRSFFRAYSELYSPFGEKTRIKHQLFPTWRRWLRPRSNISHRSGTWPLSNDSKHTPLGVIHSNLRETEVRLFDLFVSNHATYGTILKNRLKNERTMSFYFQENAIALPIEN